MVLLIAAHFGLSFSLFYGFRAGISDALVIGTVAALVTASFATPLTLGMLPFVAWLRKQTWHRRSTLLDVGALGGAISLLVLFVPIVVFNNASYPTFRELVPAGSALMAIGAFAGAICAILFSVRMAKGTAETRIRALCRAAVEKRVTPSTVR
jgi:hypothetical protein